MKRRLSQTSTICLLKQYYRSTSIEKKILKFDKVIDLNHKKKKIMSLYSSFTKAIEVRAYYIIKRVES